MLNNYIFVTKNTFFTKQDTGLIILLWLTSSEIIEMSLSLRSHLEAET